MPVDVLYLLPGLITFLLTRVLEAVGRVATSGRDLIWQLSSVPSDFIDALAHYLILLSHLH